MLTPPASTRLVEALWDALSPVIFPKGFGVFRVTLLDSSLLEEFWFGPCMRLFGLLSSSCADGQCQVDFSTVPNQVFGMLFRQRPGRHRHLPLLLVPARYVRSPILLSLTTRRPRTKEWFPLSWTR